MTNALSAFGTLLKLGDGNVVPGPEVFATIAEVTDIGGPSMSTDTIDVTNHSSPGAVKEFLMGLLDAGEVSFTVNFMPGNATHDEATGLIAEWLSRNVSNWKLVWPTTPAEAVGFKAGVTGIDFSAPTDEQLSADITLKVSGLPDFAATP